MLATAAFGRRVSRRSRRTLPGRPSRCSRLVRGTTRKDRTRGSRTLSVCTTTAGRRLSTRTHHTSPRRGSGSPVVATVLLGHASALVFTPARLVVRDVPAVPVQVTASLLPHALGLEQLRQQARTGRAATLGLLRGKLQEIVRERDTDFHRIPS